MSSCILCCLREISHEKWLAAGEQLNHEINLQSQRVLTLAKETIGEIADGRRSLTDQMDRIRRTLERSIRFINDVRDETKFQMTQVRD